MLWETFASQNLSFPLCKMGQLVPPTAFDHDEREEIMLVKVGQQI